MRHLLAILALAISIPALAQDTATLSGNLKDLGLQNVGRNGTYVAFELKNFGTTMPRTSSGLFVNTFMECRLGGTTCSIDSSGVLSGVVTRNDVIVPASTVYEVCIYDDEVLRFCDRYDIAASTFDLNTATPVTVIPPTAGSSAVITNPGGGTLQSIQGSLRLDGQVAADVQLIVEGAASQSANLQVWRDSTETVLSSVDSAGNFGILTSSPSSPLEVVGDVEFGTLFKWDNALGRMGVGTASPSVDLHVLGAGITLDNPLDGDAALKIDSGATTGNGSCVELEDQGVIIWTFCKDAANDLALTNVGTGVEVFDFKAGGNLNIRVGAGGGSLRNRDSDGNDMMTIADVGTVGDVTITGDLTVDGVMQSAVDDEVLVSNGTTMENKAVPSCSNPTTEKLLYNTSTNAFSCGTDQTSGGGLDDFSTVLLVDEFPTNVINGQLGWTFKDIAGTGSIINHADEEFNHPGLFNIRSGGTTNNASAIILGNAGATNIFMVGAIGSNAGWDATFIIKTDSTVANVEYSIGFSDAASDAPSDQIIVSFITGTDTFWTFETCGTTTCTRTPSSITPVADTFYRFRIRSTTIGEILFSVDGGSETTLSTNVPTVDLGPFIMTKTLTSAARNIFVDLFIYKATVSR